MTPRHRLDRDLAADNRTLPRDAQHVARLGLSLEVPIEGTGDLDTETAGTQGLGLGTSVARDESTATCCSRRSVRRRDVLRSACIDAAIRSAPQSRAPVSARSGHLAATRTSEQTSTCCRPTERVDSYARERASYLRRTVKTGSRRASSKFVKASKSSTRRSCACGLLLTSSHEHRGQSIGAASGWRARG